MFWFWDPTMIIAIPGLIFTLWAQAKVKSAYNKYSKVHSRAGLTGAEVARAILDRRGLTQIPVEPVRGEMTDHYDPRKSVLRLSQGVYGSRSIAAMGIAAHEAGHAVQHAASYQPLILRNAIAPAAATGSKMGVMLFMIGFFITAFSGATGLGWVMDAGIILFAVAVLFTILTLPVEYNASKRAIAILSDGGFLTRDEVPQAKAVLNAAALTYLAAAATAVLMLVRLVILRNARD